MMRPELGSRYLVLLACAACGGTPQPAPARPTPQVDEQRREFPGFSVQLPAGEVASERTSYASGELKSTVDADGTFFSVSWSPGAVSAEDLPVTISSDRAGGVASSAAAVVGPDGKPVPTIIAPYGTDATDIYSVLTCGTRRVFLAMTGRDVAARQAAMVKSFACHSDPAREPAPGAIRIGLDLPRFSVQPSGKYLGQLNLTDKAHVQLILLERPPGEGDVDVRPSLTWVSDLALEPREGEHQRFVGVDSGDRITGYAIGKRCKAFTVIATVYTRDKYAAELKPLLAPIEAARCLDDGEPLPSW